jgi:hypothetical protein
VKRERREREAEQVGAVTVPASDRRRQLLNRRTRIENSTAPRIRPRSTGSRRAIHTAVRIRVRLLRAAAAEIAR